MKCPEKMCRSDDVVYVRNRPSRTPGFQPDYECCKCGFRWIERKGGGLREMHEAVKEVRNRTGGIGGVVASRGYEP